MQVFTHSACLLHETGPGHPERTARLRAIIDALEKAHPDLDWQQAPRATRGQLLRVHDERLLAAVLETEVETLFHLDPDTVLGPHSAEAALRAAGAAVAAVDAVMHGARRAFCAVRPPGHHATTTTAMGFCLFNNVAIGAACAMARHLLQRIVIVDFDVHHGNGTQDIFENEPRVMYVSTHEADIYPHTGDASERGVGNIFNAPLPAGSGSALFRRAYSDVLLPEIDAFRPQLILISAGFDGHRSDPLADLRLEAEDYAWLTRELLALAVKHSAGRIVSTLEGGYDLAALRESTLAHVKELLG